MNLAIPQPRAMGLSPTHQLQIWENSGRQVGQRIGHYLRPRVDYTAATWADEYRVLPAGGRYTRWVTSRTPYMFEVARVMASRDPRHRYVAISKSSQLGFTALSLNEMLRLMDTDPTSIMYFRETREKIEEWKRTMLVPSLKLPPFNDRRDVKVLGDDVYFPGGYLIARGTGSSNAVAGTTAQVIIGDEVAKFAESLEGEGDFFSLATQRSSTFGEEGKAILFSTPKEKSENEGSFYQLVQHGDVRRYCTPCRHCGVDWFWEPEHISRYEEGGAELFGLRCPECERITADGNERMDAMQEGKWKPTKDPRPGFVSFEVSGMLSWRSLKDIYHALEDVTAGRRSVVSFENTIAGRFYDPPEARRATPNEVQMVMTKDVYKSEPEPVVPDGVCMLTMAVDCQKERLEWEVRGWGPQFENWSVCRGRIEKRIDQTQECMIALKEIMDRDYKRQDGRVMRIRLGAIDIGFQQDEVRSLLRFFPQPNWTASKNSLFLSQGTLIGVKGKNAIGNERLILETPATAPYALTNKGTKQVKRWWVTLGTDVAKFEVYRALRVPLDSDEVVFGRAHAPVDYQQSYFEQIVAEEVVHERNPKDGRTKTFFRPHENRANEALDLWVYTRACIAMLGAAQWSDKAWGARREAESRGKDTAPAKQKPAKSITERRAELRAKRAAKRAEKKRK